ncbi:MAG: glycosyltransferase [Paracoccaceae bacterium]
MALHNGAQYLGAQMASIHAQEGVRWQLVVSDDGSKDAGPNTLRKMRRAAAIKMQKGPQNGFAANFMSLLRGLPDRPGFVALSDQDDHWLPDKLSRAVFALQQVPPAIPALYCARSVITDANLRDPRLSPRFQRPAILRNALVQNIVAGNTVVLNPAAAKLLRDCAREAEGIGTPVSHDWWMYQIICAVGGKVIFDPAPALLYRQHGGNAVGANRGMRAGLRRVNQVLSGHFGTWCATNLHVLSASMHRFTPQAKRELFLLRQLQSRALPKRIQALIKLRPYRQSLFGTATIIGAVLLGLL